MTDIAAAMGIVSLDEFDDQSKLRKILFKTYAEELANCDRLRVIGRWLCTDREHAAWLFTVIVEDRYTSYKKKLRDNSGIESNQVHFRNDRYSIFKEFTDGKKFPNMD